MSYSRYQKFTGQLDFGSLQAKIAQETTFVLD